jgi:predicted nucleic acid-binding protein
MTVELREKMLLRGDQLLTSTITLGEILVKPLRLGDLDLCKKYEDAINSVAIVLPFDLKAARLYAAIRIDKACSTTLLRRQFEHRSFHNE